MTEESPNGRVSPCTSESTEQQMRVLLEHAFDAYVELDAEVRITDWNTRSERTYGWSREEIVGKSALTTTPARHHDLLSAMVERFFTGALSHEPVPGRALRRDGTEFPIEMCCVRLRREGSERLAIFVRDVTERRQLEAVLRETQERNRHILDHIEDGYCEVDLRGNFICVNDAYCRLFNRSKSDYESANYRKFGEDKLNDQLREVFSRVFKTGEPVKSFEYETLPGRFIESSVSLKRDGKGKPVGFVSVLRDCTERKQYERELARAKEAAEEANRSKTQFLANMSHE
ncbi:MAG TPA: PAS domain S-box protein, partial [Bryobacteraceae bacterium]|nr:PAS domain S-box protein [Bryobacteraceae bacterium]